MVFALTRGRPGTWCGQNPTPVAQLNREHERAAVVEGDRTCIRNRPRAMTMILQRLLTGGHNKPPHRSPSWDLLARQHGRWPRWGPRS